MVARRWSSSRLSCGEWLLLRCDGNAQNSFPTKQRKDPSPQVMSRKRVSSGCSRDPSASNRVETGMSGNFLSCSKGGKDVLKFQRLGVISLEKPQQKWASCRLEWRGFWIFPSFSRCSQVTTGTSGTRSRGLRNGQSPCEMLGGLPGFLCLRCRGLRPGVESRLEPADSSPVLTWIFGYIWSLPRGSST